MDEFRVKITVRNNLLLQAIEDAGFKSQTAFARFAELDVNRVNNLIGLREAPINSRGEFTPVAKQVMEVLGACPSDLWTEQQLTMELRKNTADMKMGAKTLRLIMADPNDPALLENDIDDALLIQNQLKETMANMLDSITPREAKVLKLRYGVGCEEHTLEETGKVFNCTRERIRQIEAKALRKLRHPSRSEILKFFADMDIETPTMRGNRPAPTLKGLRKKYGNYIDEIDYNHHYREWSKDVVEAAKITEAARKKLKGEPDGGLEL